MAASRSPASRWLPAALLLGAVTAPAAGARDLFDMTIEELGVPDRTALDVSIGWRPVEPLQLSLTVRNLNDDTHLQFGGGNLIERSVYLKAVWNY